MHWYPKDLQKIVIDGEGTLSLFSGRGSVVMWHASSESLWCKFWCQSKRFQFISSGTAYIEWRPRPPDWSGVEFSLPSCVRPLTYI